MKVSKKQGKAELLVFLLLIIMTSVLTVARADAEHSGHKVILTTLEQHMLKRISVDFRDTPIEDVIRIMARQAGVDIIKSPKVTGKITATLTDVPLEEALKNILKANGYSYELDKNLILVAPTEDFEQKTERLVHKVYRITYADVREVEKALRKFVSSRGSISSNFGTSNIIVADTESKIKAIDTFIQEIDRITPQFVVEARIYDISIKDRLDLGINWQAGRNTTYDSDGGLLGIGDNPTAGKTDPFATASVTGTTSFTKTADAVLRLGVLNKALDIDVILRAEQEDICAKLLANPRIMVLDNETAFIKIVSEIPYQELTQTSAGGSIGTTEFKEVGIELEVTPHLTRDNLIRLHIRPKFSVETGKVTLSTLGGTALSSPQPIIDSREADTITLIRNGQTVVIGGLRKKDIARQINKVPILGDIPFLGRLFKFEGEETINSELVVFITPRIVENPILSDTEKEQLEETRLEKCTPKCSDTRIDRCKKP